MIKSVIKTQEKQSTCNENKIMTGRTVMYTTVHTKHCPEPLLITKYNFSEIFLTQPREGVSLKMHESPLLSSTSSI